MRRYSRCLNPHCNKTAVIRGLCQACYQACKRQINAGRLTWDILIEAGKVLPLRAKQRTGPKKDWVMEGMKKPKEETPVINQENDFVEDLEI